jgi:hypothetical protein
MASRQTTLGRSNELPLTLVDATFGLHLLLNYWFLPSAWLLSAQGRLLLLARQSGTAYLLMSHHLTVFPFSGAALKHSYLICLSLTLLFKPLPRGLAAFLYCLWSRKSAQKLLLLLLLSDLPGFEH